MRIKGDRRTEIRLEGSCHCGSIRVALETALPPAALGLRACSCTFCRRHGAATVSDPAGRVELTITDPGECSRYQFGLRTSEFIVCRRCGVYLAAVFTDGDIAYATVNANALDARAELTQNPVAVSYERETADERRARRRRAWTPAVVRFAPRG